MKLSPARPPPLSSSTATLRPAERVRHYLLASFEAKERAEGERLPSVRQVATELGVSTATVQSVFHRLAEEGRIRSEAGSGSFWISSKKEAVLNIGLNIPVPQGGLPSDWTYQIYGGIMHGILQSPVPIILRPLPAEALESEEGGAKFLEESRRLDGFILYPSRFSRRLRRICEEEGRPVVDLNPSSETATANFVSPDYYGASRLLTRALRQRGRRRLALLVSPDLEESVSVRLRCAGAAAGVGEALGRTVEMRIFETESRDEEAGRQAVQRMFAEGYRPDGIYCAGDALAGGALEELAARGVNVPKDASVMGGHGLGLHGGNSAALTSMRHALDQLGAELVNMLLKRIDADGAPQPGMFLPPIFNIGSTTRSCENALLETSTAGAAEGDPKPDGRKPLPDA